MLKQNRRNSGLGAGSEPSFPRASGALGYQPTIYGFGRNSAGNSQVFACGKEAAGLKMPQKCAQQVY